MNNTNKTYVYSTYIPHIRPVFVRRNKNRNLNTETNKNDFQATKDCTLQKDCLMLFLLLLLVIPLMFAIIGFINNRKNKKISKNEK